MTELNLHTCSAMDLSRMLRNRSLSPVELLEAHIKRIQIVNPHVNAFVENRYETARMEARAAEKVLRKADPDSLPPLLGIPCTIKEFFAIEGMGWTGGLLSRKGMTASADSTAVSRLRAAGAIVMGTTNVPEGGLWMETYNKIYGRTRNPWNPERTCGGSSGGEGALVAAGASPFGIGSDVGGSIRIPAAFCGTVGHKPSGRLLPNTGHFPPAIGDAGAYLCSGPLCRRVEDLMPLLRVLAGPDGEDPLCRPFELGDPEQVDLKDLVVIPMASGGTTNVHPVMP